jgi:DNA-binding SARP family transcriptional activator
MSGTPDDAAMPSQPLTPESRTDARPEGGVGPVEQAAVPPDDRRHPSGLTIIASKIAPAVDGRLVLTRPRLVGWLTERRRMRLVLVSAEAGYGKTTLLGDFANRTQERCLWYRLESSDGDWITFLSYLIATLREEIPEFGRSTEALLRNVASLGSTREMVLAQFLSELGASGGLDVTLVLDDYHLVGDSADVRLIMGRLLERAPSGMRFILACRGRPKLALGRLMAQGQVVELTTNELRFTRTEIEELFASAYLQPLDRHACDVVAERTRGWAASLQLVAASIAASRPSEVGSFIEALSGAEGPIYDFLAEEVLDRMAPLTQRVLLHASLIDRVTPGLVTAALSVTGDPVSSAEVAAHLEDARSLGLLGESDESSSGARIHPLFREFLEHQLKTTATGSQIRAMHGAVARAAEKTAWLAAAKHYALAEEPGEAMRVLGSAASEALGTGAWGAAVEILSLIPDTPPPPAVEVMKARALTSAGRPEAALACLEAMDSASLDPNEQGLLALTRASALQVSGQSIRFWDEVERFGSIPQTDTVLNHLAGTWSLMRNACRGGPISDARRALDWLGEESGKGGLTHFAGIAYHNAATAALAQADYADAIRQSYASRKTLGLSPVDASVRHSTLATMAIAEAEAGNPARAQVLMHEAESADDLHPDVLADAVYLAAVVGNCQQAESLEQRLDRLISTEPVQVGARHQAAIAAVTRLLAVGQFAAAAERATHLTEGRFDELDGVARTAFLVAYCAVVNKSESAGREVCEALRIAQGQQAWRWELRLRLLQASLEADQQVFDRCVSDSASLSALALLEMADAVASGLRHPASVPAPVVDCVAQYPARWRPVLLRQLTDPEGPCARSAAMLLSKYGTYQDAVHLEAYDRAAPHPAGKTRFSRELVRRVTPTLRIHDLGRTTYEISGVELDASAARRKPIALILYLVTRARQTSAREQVMEELWPNQSPAAATNSLHQTLHFIRRQIAPWKGEGPIVNYVRLDSELVYLDAELVQVDSIAFVRQATEVLSSSDLANVGPSIVRLYAGRFAPEFEYEDWAEDWRTLVHAHYLRLCQATAGALVAANRGQGAVDVLSRAIRVDSGALDLRALLIKTLSQLGAADAAADHYRHYVTLMKKELGLRAPPFDVVVGRESQP